MDTDRYLNFWGSESAEYVVFKNNMQELPLFTNRQTQKNALYRDKNGYTLDTVFLRATFETRNMKAKPSDIFVTSFPKSGTTWLQEIVFAIQSNLDFEQAKSVPLSDRFPFLELSPIKLPDDRTTPALIMSHHSYSYLPKSIIDNKSKILYIARNPKDVLVSFYHFYKMNRRLSFSGSFHEYFDMFLNGNVLYAPFPDHILGFWERRHEDNIHFLTYENLQKNTIDEIKKIAEFLDKRLTDEQVHQIAAHCSMANMSKTPSMNYSDLVNAGVYDANVSSFLRKGKVADWKNYLDDNMNEIMDRWIDRNFGHTDLTFDFD